MPLGDLDFGVSTRITPATPRRARSFFIPRHQRNRNSALAYGGVHFASKMGQLAGNHFITLTSNLENLPALGKTVLWKGAQNSVRDRVMASQRTLSDLNACGRDDFVAALANVFEYRRGSLNKSHPRGRFPV